MSFKAGFDETGKLRAVKGKIYGDVGCSTNESPVMYAANMAQNCYYSPKWNYVPVSVLTNTPSNTWTRSPGLITNNSAVIITILFICNWFLSWTRRFLFLYS
jgi:xanthine dehydrogenase molybdopterin-binding subunit B